MKPTGSASLRRLLKRPLQWCSAPAAVILFLLVASPARAVMSKGYSLEWLCRFSPVVVRVRLVGGEGASGEFAPVEAFKGKADEVIRFDFEGAKPGRKGTNYLLFLAPGEKGVMEVRYWVDLDQPTVEKGPGIAFDK